MISESYIKLYDISDKHFAYLIQFSEKNTQAEGILTLGALRDGLTFYRLTENKKLLDEVEEFRLAKTDEIITFVPPNSLYTKNKNDRTSDYQPFGRETSYIENNVLRKSVENTDENINSTLTNFYNQLRSSEIAEENKLLLSELSSTDKNEITLQSSRSSSSVFLSKWQMGDFLPVENGEYYGGDQGWLGSNSSNGCGPTAAANAVAYLAHTNPSGRGELYDYGNLSSSSAWSKSNYTNHMSEMYDYMDPINAWYGLTDVNQFQGFVELFARTKGIFNLTTRYIEDSDCNYYSSVENFITTGLNSDTPICALNKTFPFINGTYEWHWITITGFIENGPTSNQVVVSTWENKRLLIFTHIGKIFVRLMEDSHTLSKG